MGGHSKSSNSTSNTSTTNTTSTNVQGTNGISGDNEGVALSGVNNSKINITASDHNAIQKAADIAELSINKNSDNFKEGLKTLARSNDHSSDNYGKSLNMMAGLTGSQAAQNAKNLKALKELATLKIDGGQTATTKEMSKVIIIIAVLFVIAFVYLMVRK